MKFYESYFDEYVQSVLKCNFHPELVEEISMFPSEVSKFENIILYGPCGSGKYSQMLYILHKYHFGYEKKIVAIMEKQTYRYKISDIHYEIDMSLLGCNSKNLWHIIYENIIDIISVKGNRHGIIVCKNFHCIHNELLDIFYNYIQQYNQHSQMRIQVKFIIITEHISFINDNIKDACYMMNVKKPDSALLAQLLQKNESDIVVSYNNLKEMYIPDVYITSSITICNNIIAHMNSMKYSLVNTEDIIRLREKIYDILIYNLDVYECIWYIFTHFLKNNFFEETKRDYLFTKIHTFFVQYGNNYRAIFHIENLLFVFVLSINPDILHNLNHSP
jgi:hypothetical protein